MRIKNNTRNIEPVNMGKDYFPVIVSNIGVSSPNDDIKFEVEKARIAVEMGADIISDLSLAPNISDIQKWYLDNINCPISAVPIYETFFNMKVENKVINEETFIRDFENQASRGIDLLTLHATVFKEDIKLIADSHRLIPSTSRGGAMMLYCMNAGLYENPYYSYFDDILAISHKYGVCLSLGPMYRPASVWDCQNENSLHFLELERMAELVEKANNAGVGIAIEGIGHAPLNTIQSLISKAKQICLNAPYRVLTVSTDRAMGYDHIASAIASAVAVQYGADSITCVTRSEHIGLPSMHDIRESIVCAKIAAESGYRARKNEFPFDEKVSKMRHLFGCHADSPDYLFHLNTMNCDHRAHKGKSCGMCGDFCPFIILDSLNESAK